MKMENLHGSLLKKIVNIAEQMKDVELEIIFKQKLNIAEEDLNQIKRMINK